MAINNKRLKISITPIPLANDIIIYLPVKLGENLNNILILFSCYNSKQSLCSHF